MFKDKDTLFFKMTVKVSIVMSYLNRKQQFLKTLESIHNSSIPKEDYEIIVVDDGSEPEHDLSDVSGIRLVKISKCNKNWTCPVIPYNLGITKANGDWIILQNPEVKYDDGDFLKFLIENADHETYYSAHVLSLNPDGSPSSWYSHPEYRNCFYHFCIAIHKTKLDLLGGFNPEMKDGVDYDDVEFVERVKKVCSKMEYVKILCSHQWHPSFSYMYPDTHERRQKNKEICDKSEGIYKDPHKYLPKQKLLIFGGTGSLGYHLVKRYIDKYDLYVASRDETKQWEMKMKFPSVKFSICDIRDKLKVKYVIDQINPEVIIIASAMKHVDLCEIEINECIQTNIIGTKNILESLNNGVNTICFVSTDKVCNPVNVYGMSKGISEALMIQYSLKESNKKFVTVRYGNVLNSRGSIIPILHQSGKDETIKKFKLTHPDMTRFIMTLDQSVDLIDYAINHAESGDVVIPELISMKVKDLVEIFSEMYEKPIEISGLRPGEKLLESLINETQSLRIRKNEKYTHIKPRQVFEDNIPLDYNSSINQISKEELRNFLKSLNLI